MKIYHYTTIDSLAMILSSRSIKFNRLDKVDDLEERTEPSQVSCGNICLCRAGLKTQRRVSRYGGCIRAMRMG